MIRTSLFAMLVAAGALAGSMQQVSGQTYGQTNFIPNPNYGYVNSGNGYVQPNYGNGVQNYGYGNNGYVQPNFGPNGNSNYGQNYTSNPAFGTPAGTLPGSNPNLIGPSNSPTIPLGQQNTLQNGNTIRLPSAGGSSNGSQAGGQKSVRGMLIEGTASVIDGDTFYVDQQMVLLYGADAPEIDQTCTANGTAWRCGMKAKEELARLIDGKYVSCVGQRPAGDAVAVVCRISVGDVGEMMVQAGMAVVPYELSKAYNDSQIQAKNSRRGVWAGTFSWPWEFRAKSANVRVAR